MEEITPKNGVDTGQIRRVGLGKTRKPWLGIVPGFSASVMGSNRGFIVNG